MQKQLSILHKILTKVDENVEISKSFYENTIGKSKFSLIKESLHQIEHDVCGHGDCVEINSNRDKLLVSLNARYHQNQHRYCWPSHMSHFHMTLEQWINCPMTCIAEINEFIEKIIKGD
jgi:hypothetical protein